MRKVIMLTAACIVMAACQTADKTETVNINELAALMENTFVTPADDPKNIIRDVRVRITSDELDGIWYYTQLNTGDEYKLYRQRVSQLTISNEGSQIVQIAYGLKDPAKYADAWKTPGLLNALTQDDFDPYFTKGCEQIWTPQEGGAWTGYVNPGTCVITSKRRNKDIRIESEGYLSHDVYRTNERGYDMDMAFLWGTKPGEFITLYPLN